MRKSLIHAALLASGLAAGAPAAFAQTAAQNNPAARGAYLAVAADCAACHTAAGGKPYAGGLPITTPLGNIFASNITPSQADGIGGWSEQDFARALRQGVRKDGANLYPAMPYTAYAGLTDADVAALYAYFTQNVQPVDAPAPATKLPFPFSIRASMMGWNLLFLHGKPFQPDPAHDAQWNRGAYLSEALAHCSTCHTPRNALMAEQPSQAMAGASLGTWYAPNITSDPQHGIGGWNADQLAAYLVTGHSGNGSQAGGPMREAIDRSFSHLSAADIAAIVTYIRSLPPHTGLAAPGNTAKAAPLDDDVALLGGTAPEGAMLYADHCAACHQADGAGGNGLPALLGNAALRLPVADNAVMAILAGLTPATGQAMPGFAKAMDDAQVAALTNYLFTSLGDAGVQISPERVAALRAGGAASPLLALARDGTIAAGVVIFLLLLGLLDWFFRRRRPA
jgi:mono/diheme cytochrome c family protein